MERNNGVISGVVFSPELGEALEAAVTSMSLDPVDRLSTIEDRVSMLLGEQVTTCSVVDPNDFCSDPDP